MIIILLVALLLSSPVFVNAQDLSKANIEKVLKDAYEKFKDVKEGANADYIKELATVDPNIFGIAFVTTDGQVYTAVILNRWFQSRVFQKYLLWQK